jgi:hypothetical protein
VDECVREIAAVVSLTPIGNIKGCARRARPNPGAAAPGSRVVVACNPAFFFAGFVAPALQLPLVINHEQRRKP